MRFRTLLMICLAALLGGCPGVVSQFDADAGQPLDAGRPLDAGQLLDAGQPLDAGAADGGQRLDAGTVPDAGPSLTVDAGADVALVLPTRSTTLQASASASDGGEPTLAWAQRSGPDATVAPRLGGALEVRGLVPGTYVFEVTARLGALSASDDVTVTVSAPAGSVTHYVSRTGNDQTGDGSRASPWATLARACSLVHTAGDVIHVLSSVDGAGHDDPYVETQQCVLAPQVSLEGDGELPGSPQLTHLILHDMGGASTDTYSGAIQAVGPDTGHQLGSQSISGLWLDGNDAVHRGIMVRGRSGVVVRHVRLTRFRTVGVAFLGIVKMGALVAYETDNEFSSSTGIDCAMRATGAAGTVAMTGQDGLVIRDNVFEQFARPLGQNGDLVNGVGGHNRGWAYYRNYSTKRPYDGPQYDAGGPGWNMGLEIWANEGGTEIWGNTFIGGGCAIDIGGSTDGNGTVDVPGNYPYTWYVHDNTFELADFEPGHSDSIVPMGIQFEVSSSQALLSHNHFHRLAHGVQLILTHANDTAMHHITIRHNFFDDMGLSDTSVGAVMVNIQTSTGQSLSDIDIDHNTMISGTNSLGTLSRAAVELTNLSPMGTLERVRFRNNVVEHVGAWGSSAWGYLVFNGYYPITDVTSSHNVMFDNARNNGEFTHAMGVPAMTPPVTWATPPANLTADPQLDADGHPLPGSPVFDAGLDLGFGTTVGAFPQ